MNSVQFFAIESGSSVKGQKTSQEKMLEKKLLITKAVAGIGLAEREDKGHLRAPLALPLQWHLLVLKLPEYYL